MTDRRFVASLAAALTIAAIGGAGAETLPVPPLEPGQPAHAAPVRRAVHVRRARPSPEDQAYAGPATLSAGAVQPRFDAAPTPNDEIAPQHLGPTEVNTEPKLFTVKTVFRGDGFPYGATSQGMDDKYSVKVPGLNVTVPLQQ